MNSIFTTSKNDPCVHTNSDCNMPGIDETHPEIAAQWHPTKNGDLKPSDFTAGSNKKVWWLCPNKCPEGCVHEWEARVASRCNGNNCPCCSNLKICIHKSIVMTHPKICEQWHPTRNGNLMPENVTAGNNKKVWWLCSKTCSKGCAHEWESSINNRCSKNAGCPICAHLKIGCEHNSIVYTHPKIAAEWHPTKNGSLKPSQFTNGTNIKVWWLCPNKCPEGCLHEWETSIHNRCNYGCPYCAQRLVSCIHVSIKTTHPEVAAQWHPTKNGLLKPSDITSGSGKKVWWLCPNTCNQGCLHEWKAAVYSKCARNICAYCSNRAISCIHASLVNTHPKIASQWHPTKNGSLKPKDFTSGSGEKIWWNCDKGHEWQSAIYSRCGNNHGCPRCLNKTEAKLLDYLKILNHDTQPQCRASWCKSPKTNRLLPFDFYIPTLKLIIELDGPQHFKQISNWDCHSQTVKRDVYKMKCALKEGISVLRILQEDVWAADDAWLDEKLKPHLVSASDAKYTFIVEAKDESIYDEHRRLMLSDEMPALESDDDSDTATPTNEIID